MFFGFLNTEKIPELMQGFGLGYFAILIAVAFFIGDKKTQFEFDKKIVFTHLIEKNFILLSLIVFLLMPLLWQKLESSQSNEVIQFASLKYFFNIECLVIFIYTATWALKKLKDCYHWMLDEKNPLETRKEYLLSLTDNTPSLTTCWAEIWRDEKNLLSDDDKKFYLELFASQLNELHKKFSLKEDKIFSEKIYPLLENFRNCILNKIDDADALLRKEEYIPLIQEKLLPALLKWHFLKSPISYTPFISTFFEKSIAAYTHSIKITCLPQTAVQSLLLTFEEKLKSLTEELEANKEKAFWLIGSVSRPFFNTSIMWLLSNFPEDWCFDIDRQTLLSSAWITSLISWVPKNAIWDFDYFYKHRHLRLIASTLFKNLHMKFLGRTLMLLLERPNVFQKMEGFYFELFDDWTVDQWVSNSIDEQTRKDRTKKFILWLIGKRIDLPLTPYILSKEHIHNWHAWLTQLMAHHPYEPKFSWIEEYCPFLEEVLNDPTLKNQLANPT